MLHPPPFSLAHFKHIFHTLEKPFHTHSLRTSNLSIPLLFHIYISLSLSFLLTGLRWNLLRSRWRKLKFASSAAKRLLCTAPPTLRFFASTATLGFTRPISSSLPIFANHSVPNATLSPDTEFPMPELRSSSLRFVTLACRQMHFPKTSIPCRLLPLAFPAPSLTPLLRRGSRLMIGE